MVATADEFRTIYLRVAGDFWRVCLVRCCVCRDVMVKCSEPIVVAHSGLAAKQCMGTRGHPTTVTDKTALVWGQWVCGCVWESWSRVSGVCVEF